MRGKRAETVNQLEEIQRAVPVIALALAIVALIVAAVAMDTSKEAQEAQEATKAERPAVIFAVGQDMEATLLVGDAWEFAALYRAEENPEEKQRIGEALERWECTANACPTWA